MVHERHRVLSPGFVDAVRRAERERADCMARAATALLGKLRNGVMHQPSRAYLLLTFAALFWAGNVVLGRAVAGKIPPITLNYLRWLIALGILLPLAWSDLRASAPVLLARPAQLVALAVPSVAIYNAFLYVGTQTTTALDAGLIVGLVPIVILAFASAIGQQRLSWKSGSGVLVSAAGAAWVIARGDLNLLLSLSFVPGDLFIAGSVLSWAGYSVLLRRFAVPLPPCVLLLSLAVIGLVVSAPFEAREVAHGAVFDWSIVNLLAVVYVGVFPAVIGTLFWNRAVAEIGATTAGLFFNLIPVFVVLLAVGLLGEPLELFHLAGMGLIVFGIWLATRTTNPARLAEPALSEAAD